jgi:hypothetical protein
MTDFEDTKVILEGPPLDAGETVEDRPGHLERRAESYCFYTRLVYFVRNASVLPSGSGVIAF